MYIKKMIKKKTLHRYYTEISIISGQNKALQAFIFFLQVPITS
jgi:hypothetical protein